MSNEEKYYAFTQEPNFDKGYEFSKPDETVRKILTQQLVELKSKRKEIVIEAPLKEKERYEYVDINKLTDKIIKDLELNYKDYSKEFEGEPLGFKYIIGSELIFTSSVEIIQKVYHLKPDIGNLLYTLVVKYSNGRFHYWTW